ncbi:MAG: hypothetical protein ACK4N5_01195, partial [Myxococcales bacterium]
MPLVPITALVLAGAMAAAAAKDEPTTVLQIAVSLPESRDPETVGVLLNGQAIERSDDGLRFERKVTPGLHELTLEVEHEEDDAAVMRRALTLDVPKSGTARVQLRLEERPDDDPPLALDVQTEPSALLASADGEHDDVSGGFGGSAEEPAGAAPAVLLPLIGTPATTGVPGDGAR